jgi:hypothetical protein
LNINQETGKNQSFDNRSKRLETILFRRNKFQRRLKTSPVYTNKFPGNWDSSTETICKIPEE